MTFKRLVYFMLSIAFMFITKTVDENRFVYTGIVDRVEGERVIIINELDRKQIEMSLSEIDEYITEGDVVELMFANDQYTFIQINEALTEAALTRSQILLERIRK